MAATFPTSAKSFTTRISGDTIQPGHVNDLQDEVAAIETDLLKAWPAYTPVWTALSVNPTIGNGSIVGQYLQRGKLVFVDILLTYGSTSAPGTGSWRFSLPVAASLTNTIMHCVITDTGTRHYFVGVQVSTATTVLILDGSTSGGTVSDASPITWATGDVVHVSGFYIAA